MKYTWFVFLVLTFALGACSAAPGSASPQTSAPAVMDRSGLVVALEAAGATVKTGDPLSQPFFSVEGQIFNVNGADVQVFEYESSAAMESEASTVSSDGSSAGTNMVSWIAPPHFFKSGRIIAIYVGDDKTILSLLQQVMGSQFAGQ